MSLEPDLEAMLKRTESVIERIDSGCAVLEGRIDTLNSLVTIAAQAAHGSPDTAADRRDALIAERVAHLYVPVFERVAEMTAAVDGVFDNLAVFETATDGDIVAGEEALEGLKRVAADMKALTGEALVELEGASENVQTEAEGWTETVEVRTEEIVGIIDDVIAGVEATTLDADDALGALIEAELFARINEVADAIDGYLQVADQAIEQAGGAVIDRLGEASEKIASVTEVMEQVQELTEPFEAFL